MVLTGFLIYSHSGKKRPIEQISIAVTLWTSSLEVLGSNLGQDTTCADLAYRRFPQFFQTFKLGCERLLSVYLSFHNTTLYSLVIGSVAKQTTHKSTIGLCV
jgi:hypothetical protein